MESTSQHGAEFDLPPAKRQCTQSPRRSPTTDQQTNSPPIAALSPPTLPEPPVSGNMIHTGPGSIPIPGLGAVDENEGEVRPKEESGPYGILDVLMQHVESASTPAGSHGLPETTINIQEPGGVAASALTGERATLTAIANDGPLQEAEAYKEHAVEDERTGDGPRPETAHKHIPSTSEPEPSVSGADENIRKSDGQPQNIQRVEPDAAEWEADSSPLESSSDSDTSNLSSSEEDSDEGMGGEYAMLGLEEQARILMQGDGGSDDEGGDRKGGDKAASQLRTTNEKPEEVIPKPNITLTDEKIEDLGVVERIVESTVLVRAKVSGEYQVLESGSLLCLKDRTVVGVVAELFGRVEQPMYTIRFTNDAAIQEAGLSAPGTAVYYVEPPYSTFVFTQSLKSLKGSDASNFHDEEVGDDEMEFSDDEAEADHKRRLKLKRQGRRDDRGGRPTYQNDQRRPSVSHTHDSSANGSAYGDGAIEMNYDDVDEGYTPLIRPSNLHLMTQGEPPIQGRPTNGRGSNDRGRGRSRGRGRGIDRGRGRGSRASGQNLHDQAQWNDRRAPDPAFSPRISNVAPTFVPPPTSPYQHQPFQQHFQQANGPPQIPAYPPFSPSPISPLPHTQFSFNPQQPQQWAYQYQYGANQQAQSHAQTPMPPPGSYVNPAFLEALRQHQQGQGR